MHLERIEVPLVIEHVTNGLPILLDLSELEEEHVVELSEILLHVVYGNAFAQLVEDGLDAAIEFALQLTNFGVVVLLGLGVLFEPVLAIGEHLVHPALQVVIASVVLEEFVPHVHD